MNCEEYRELISAAMDGECDEEELRALNAHLSECEECREYAAALREISELMGSDLPSPGEDFTEAVMDAVRAEAAKSKKGRLLPVRRRYLTLAASLLVVVGLGMLAKRTFSPKGAAAVQTEAASLDMADTPMMMYAAAAPECSEEEAAFDYAAEEPAEAAPENGMMLFAAPAAPMEKNAAESVAGSTAERPGGAGPARPGSGSAATSDGAFGESSANTNTAPAAPFRPELAADDWLRAHMADPESYSRLDAAWTETPPDFEPVAEHAHPEECWSVSYTAPEGETLTLLLDRSSTVFGLVREQ